jgi:long-chain acyl-CoA synthetase
MQEPFASLWDLFEKSTRAYAHKPLFGTKLGGAWRWITYDEFRKDVDRFRGALARLGVTRGDRVALVGPNGVEWAIAAYATYGRGASFVPMYEAQHPEEWELILADSGAKVVIAGARAVHDQLSALKAKIPTLEHVIGIALSDTDPSSFRFHLVRGGTTPVEPVTPEPTDIAAYLYTSGTTGKPKGVLLTHANVCSNINGISGLFDFEADERSLAFLPWAHAFGQTSELHLLVSKGASLAINDDVTRLVDNLAEVRPTILFAVPRIFNRIYDAVHQQMASQPSPVRALFGAAVRVAAKRSRGEAPSFVERGILAAADKAVFSRVRARFGGRLKWAASGSAALGLEVAEFIDALGIEVYEGYGLTETSPIATTNSPGKRKIGSVGRALPGVRIEIDRRATGDDRIGEIVVHGPNVMKGYNNRPEENAVAFTPDGGFRTGDLGYLDGDGFLFITGRIKEQYKLENGKYVAPAPLEEKLKLSPYIANAMIYGANKPYNVALIVPDRAAIQRWATAQNITVHDMAHDDRVRELLHQEIGREAATFKGFERPTKFAVVAEDFTTDNGMLTPTLKLKRNKVLERYGADLNRLY